MCRSAIEKLCKDEDEDEIMDCLIEHRNDPALKKPCRKVVERRMLEQVTDIRLQPKLRHSCKHEIDTHCKHEMDKIKMRKASEDDNTNTVVICLRKAFITKDQPLGAECYEEVKSIIMESELDPRLDPPFYQACKQDIKDNCPHEIISGLGHGQIVECMNAVFYNTEVGGASPPSSEAHHVADGKKIKSPQCIQEMERRTREEAMDIHIDTSLHEACSSDMARFCSDVPAGQSRIIACLFTHLSDPAQADAFTPTCRGRLEERQRLWKIIFKNSKLPMDIAGLAQVLQASPARNSFLSLLLLVVVVLFVLGLCCGRVTKRVRRELKDR
jgi:Golgi apparatus protein 1